MQLNKLGQMLKDIQTIRSIVHEANGVMPDITGLIAQMGFGGGSNTASTILSAISSIANSPYIQLGVRKDDPKKLIDAVYKTKAMFYHPDSENGDSKKFRELQKAYDEIKKFSGR